MGKTPVQSGQYTSATCHACMVLLVFFGSSEVFPGLQCLFNCLGGISISITSLGSRQSKERHWKIDSTKLYLGTFPFLVKMSQP